MAAIVAAKAEHATSASSAATCHLRDRHHRLGRRLLDRRRCPARRLFRFHSCVLLFAEAERFAYTQVEGNLTPVRFLDWAAMMVAFAAGAISKLPNFVTTRFCGIVEAVARDGAIVEERIAIEILADGDVEGRAGSGH